MRQKGPDAAAWNWQVYDKSQGIFPNEEAKASDDFDLAEELDKADLSVGLSKRPSDRLLYRQPARVNVSQQMMYQRGS